MKKILKFFIKLYRKFISPLLPNACRFTPTCSEYAIEAIDKFGAIRGSILAVWRILRCNPFCRGGYDPVPDKFTFKRQETTGEKND
jgi:putative membrane protein insertion efficiency factor